MSGFLASVTRTTRTLKPSSSDPINAWSQLLDTFRVTHLYEHVVQDIKNRIRLLIYWYLSIPALLLTILGWQAVSGRHLKLSRTSVRCSGLSCSTCAHIPSNMVAVASSIAPKCFNACTATSMLMSAFLSSEPAKVQSPTLPSFACFTTKARVPSTAVEARWLAEQVGYQGPLWRAIRDDLRRQVTAGLLRSE